MKQLFAFAFAAIVTACVPAAGYQTSYPQSPSYAQTSAPQSTSDSQAQPAYGTAVYINGQELTAAQKAELDGLLGDTLPVGRYTLDAQYNFGYEGQPPAFNLAAHVRSRRGQRAEASAEASGEASTSSSSEPFSMYSRDSSGQGSSLVSDGNGCMIMSTPTGSLSSGC